MRWVLRGHSEHTQPSCPDVKPRAQWALCPPSPARPARSRPSTSPDKNAPPLSPDHTVTEKGPGQALGAVTARWALEGRLANLRP